MLRVPGKGYAADVPGGLPGDLLLLVRSAPDAHFQRDGPNLWHLQEIDVADAVLGCELSIPTLNGAVVAKVPPGTQPGAELRLRGKGLPRFGQRGRGDAYVRLVVRVPERLNSEERKLWERLRTLRAPGTASGS